MKRVLSVITLVSTLSTLSLFGTPAGNGILFDGHTAFKLDHPETALNPQGFTVSLWVKPDNSQNNQIFLTMGEPAKDFSLYLYKNQVRMLIQHEGNKYSYAIAPSPVAKEWTHYAGTYDGQTIKVYQNGGLKGEKKAPFKQSGFNSTLSLGSSPDNAERVMKGAMEDIRIWNSVLSGIEIKNVFSGDAIEKDLIAQWTLRGYSDKGINTVKGRKLELVKYQPADTTLLNKKQNGFRGIWYFNQKSGDEYVYKYSGGLGTYCAKHRPLAWYAKEVDKTFFCYGGTDEKNSTLLHMVSYYDHKTGMVAKPTLLLDKKTDDAHDNPVMNIDDKGYIWIFSSSHGTGRPSFISKSVKPWDIDKFELIWKGNYSYPQPTYYPGKGFLFMHTWYSPERGLYIMTSNPDGTKWSKRKKISYIERGSYQVSDTWQNKKTGTAFNMHPKAKGLNWRTNLYYMESDDFGESWKSVDGQLLDIPLTNAKTPALVAEYQSKHRNVYMKDVQFDSKGNPLILVLISKGYQAGPQNGPREWTLFHWNGKSWDTINTGIKSGNNYDTGSIYVESDTTWRIIGPTRLGPQPYNPGGEISMWLTEDAGKSWKEVLQMTGNSERNHTYVRRPMNFNEDFYGIWADGHGRKPSESALYFCNKQGDVFALPLTMTTDFAKPEKVK